MSTGKMHNKIQAINIAHDVQFTNKIPKMQFICILIAGHHTMAKVSVSNMKPPPIALKNDFCKSS